MFRGAAVWREGIVRITLSNPARLPRLLAFLAFDSTAVVTPIGDSEVEVSFLGSLNESAQRCELELRLQAWLAANPDTIAAISDYGV